MLNTLKNLGYTQAILSAQNAGTLKQSIEYYKLNGLFDYVSGLDDHYAIGKIQQGQNLIQNLNYTLDEIIMIGDTEHDYEVAKAMGIKWLLIDRGHNSTERLKAKQADVLNSFEKLMDYIN